MIDGTKLQSWEDVWALEPGTYSWVQQTPLSGWQPEDTPTGALRVELTVRVSKQDTRTCELAYVDGVTHLRRYFGEHAAQGGRIARIATATPPQEYDLPIAVGWNVISSAKYCKTQENVVLINCSIEHQTTPQNITITTLPIGFHPKFNINIPCQIMASNGDRYCGDISIGTDGVINFISHVIPKYISFYAGFIAE